MSKSNTEQNELWKEANRLYNKKEHTQDGRDLQMESFLIVRRSSLPSTGKSAEEILDEALKNGGCVSEFERHFPNTYRAAIKAMHSFRNQSPEAQERFKKPTDEQIIKSAILFNDGNIDKKKLSDMVALAEFIINRLHENGDILIPSSTETK